MKELLIHIELDDYNREIELLRWKNTSQQGHSAYMTFPADLKGLQEHQDRIQNIESEINRGGLSPSDKLFAQELSSIFEERDAGYNWMIYQNWNEKSLLKKYLKLLAYFPFFIVFSLIWGIPLMLLVQSISRRIKDPCFTSTFRFAMGLLTGFLYSFLLAGIISVIYNAYVGFFSLVLLFLSAGFGLRIMSFYREYMIFLKLKRRKKWGD